MTQQSDATGGTPASPGDALKARAAGNGFAPSFVLAAACCRWPPSEARHAAVRTAAHPITDWNDFLLQVSRQRVAGLVHAALASAEVALPPATAKKLAALALRIARQNLRYAAETIRLQRAFEAANITVLALKGIALAQLAYGSIKAKDSRDIDLLISSDQVEAALLVLEREGYALSHPAERLSKTQRRAVFRYAREVQLIRRDRKLRVELQWRATNNPLLLKGIDANSPAQLVRLGDGMCIRTLAQEDLFAYLCVHGAQHAWSRLKWLADLNALIAESNESVERLYRHAQPIGAAFCAGQALLLCNQLFELKLPPGLADEIERDGRSRRLAKMAALTMLDSRAEAQMGRSFVSKMRVILAQFLLGKGWAFFWAEYRVEFVRILDVIDFPLPAFLHFVYPLIRLPLWLWRRGAATVTRRRT
ncbi:MAG: nucleotidyltransferase family protein [Xanthobacteraceae bacterium]